MQLNLEEGIRTSCRGLILLGAVLRRGAALEGGREDIVVEERREMRGTQYSDSISISL